MAKVKKDMSDKKCYLEEEEQVVEEKGRRSQTREVDEWRRVWRERKLEARVEKEKEREREGEGVREGENGKNGGKIERDYSFTAERQRESFSLKAPFCPGAVFRFESNLPCRALYYVYLPTWIQRTGKKRLRTRYVSRAR